MVLPPGPWAVDDEDEGPTSDIVPDAGPIVDTVFVYGKSVWTLELLGELDELLDCEELDELEDWDELD
jgi:hypothetical protein